MKTPWAEMLQTSVRLGLAPESFWRLSLREWRLLTAMSATDRPMSRAMFEQMAEAWPDDR